MPSLAKIHTFCCWQLPNCFQHPGLITHGCTLLFRVVACAAKWGAKYFPVTQIFLKLFVKTAFFISRRPCSNYSALEEEYNGGTSMTSN
jgi:hypothetical protein